MAIIRVREHVNPLSQKYQTPVSPPDWSKVYAQPEQPLHVDIGCGRGQFLLKMAQIRPDWNFLGLEIREPLVVQASSRRDELGLINLHYIFCNVNNSLRQRSLAVGAALPQAIGNCSPTDRRPSLFNSQCVQGVTIQFPDPWFKRRHQKRRLVQPELVEDLAVCLQVGGYLFIQSDVEAVMIEMRDRFEAHPAFENQSGPGGWITDNPMPVASERELSTLEQGLPVYRALFLRVQVA
jgi:tRNA (guanine-N7-)-methyltransferase